MPDPNQERALKLAQLINQSQHAGQVVDPGWLQELNRLAAAGSAAAQRYLSEFASSGVLAQMNFGAPTTHEMRSLGQAQTGEPNVGWGDFLSPLTSLPGAVAGIPSTVLSAQDRYKNWLERKEIPWYGEGLYRLSDLAGPNTNTIDTINAYEQGYGPFTGGEAVMAQRFGEHPLFYRIAAGKNAVDRYQKKYDEWEAEHNRLTSAGGGGRLRQPA